MIKADTEQPYKIRIFSNDNKIISLGIHPNKSVFYVLCHARKELRRFSIATHAEVHVPPSLIVDIYHNDGICSLYSKSLRVTFKRLLHKPSQTR